MKIEGEKIYLTAIEKEDTDDIVRWRNKECVKSKFIYQGTFTREGHMQWMEQMIETGKVVQFIIWDRETQRKIGSVYLRDIDKINKKAEFGIFIGEEEMLGKGYGKETAKLMVEYAFENLKINKVFLRVLADNERAYRSYLKAGFEKEGLFKQDVIINGCAKDVIFMAKFAN